MKMIKVLKSQEIENTIAGEPEALGLNKLLKVSVPFLKWVFGLQAHHTRPWV